MRSMRSLSAEFNPEIVLIIIGKKATSAAVTILDVTPRPNQRTNSGASATFGIDWNMMM